MVIRRQLRQLLEYLSEKFSKYKVISHLIFGILVGSFITNLYAAGVLEKIELLTLDRRFRLRKHIPASKDIIHIDMGEDSIEAIGRWPWPRSWHAAITAILAKYKPRMIIYDVVFSEKGNPENDALFRDAIKEAGNVYLGLLYNTTTLDCKKLFMGENIRGVLKPIKMFDEVIKGEGHLNAIPDSDGIIRRIPPVITYKGRKTFHISVISSLDFLDIAPEDVKINPQKNILELKNSKGKVIKVPLDRNNQLIVNWVAEWGKAFRHFSYIDVIRSHKAIEDGREPIIDLNIFKDKILLIGLTASALIDIKPVPIQNIYPAVGTNAAVINSFIKNDFIKTTTKSENILLIYLMSIVVSLLLFRLRPINGMMLTALIVVLYSTLAFFIFDTYATLVNVSYPIAAILFSYIFIALYTQITAAIERNKLFRDATRDGLTNLYNIRHFNLLLEAEFRTLKLHKAKKAAIIMSDIDNFKKVNDTHGHQVGDVILHDVAKIFQSNCRQIDVVARYGGEEFIALLPGAGEKEALDVAERIRQSVESRKFKFKDKQYTATISIGVSEYRNEESREDIVRKADNALYKAKTSGKNKVVAA